MTDRQREGLRGRPPRAWVNGVVDAPRNVDRRLEAARLALEVLGLAVPVLHLPFGEDEEAPLPLIRQRHVRRRRRELLLEHVEAATA